ncbi:MAG: glycosyltransferase, partial [Bacteroidota bacterium]
MNTQGRYYELCVLIPCFNNLQGLKKSIESIFYDKGKYLIVVVDDGSSEIISNETVSGRNSKEAPVHIIRLQQNKGIAVALNTGLQWIMDTVNCDYIARLDCGDTCDASRFYKQVEHLRVNTDTLLLGSWCYFQNQDKNIRYKHRTPVKHESIINSLYFRNVFIHPTIIIRRCVLKEVGLYPENYPHAEDYAWFWQIANHGKTAILPLYLVVCELNMAGISYKNRRLQLQNRIAILKQFGHKFALRQLAI